MPLWAVNFMYKVVIIFGCIYGFLYLHGPSEPAKYLDSSEIRPRGLPNGKLEKK